MSQVYFRDIRAAGLCPAGFRAWARERGWSRREITEFLKHGTPIETVEAIDDVFAKRVVQSARARFAREAERG